ncbi:MAG: hypothetical protein MUF30_12455 [Burkholderiales bacterium]|jgi:hypothetical protein|nr:hypothetical protein [Burkholderiales bacterium]
MSSRVAARVTVVRVVTAAGLALAVTAGAADLRVNVEAGALHDSNLNRARGGNERSDQALFVEAAVAKSAPLGASAGIVGRVGLRLRAQRTYDALNQAALVGRLAWRWQPTPGFTAPTLEAALHGEALRHADSALRDGAIVAASVGASQHLTDRLRLATHFTAERRFADTTGVFDLRTWRAAVAVDWRASDRVTVYGSATWLDGDHVIGLRTGAAPGYAPGWFRTAAPDTAFDRGADRFTAYRVDARSLIGEIGVNVPLDAQQSLDLSVMRIDTRAEAGPTYGVWQVRGSWIRGF